MTPDKKDRSKTPETITPTVEEECGTCSEAEEGTRTKSSVRKDDKKTMS